MSLSTDPIPTPIPGLGHGTFSGCWREIGQQHGSQFSSIIQECYEHYCVRSGKVPACFATSIRHYVERHFPEICEEIEGIALGAGLTYEEALVYNHFPVLTAFPMGCTPIYMRHSEFGPILAKTQDCTDRERQVTLVRIVRPREGHPFATATWVGFAGVGASINGAGVAIAAVSAHQREERHNDATFYNLVLRDALVRSENAEEFFSRIRTARVLGKIGIQFVCDANGTAFHVEGHSEERFALPITADFAYSAGLHRSGKVTAKDEPDYLAPKVAREATLEAYAKSDKLRYSFDGMRDVLCHHKEGIGSVCRHGTGKSDTQGVRIMLPRHGKFFYSDGPLCTAPLQEFAL